MTTKIFNENTGNNYDTPTNWSDAHIGYAKDKLCFFSNINSSDKCFYFWTETLGESYKYKTRIEAETQKNVLDNNGKLDYGRIYIGKIVVIQ